MRFRCENSLCIDALCRRRVLGGGEGCGLAAAAGERVCCGWKQFTRHVGGRTAATATTTTCPLVEALFLLSPATATLMVRTKLVMIATSGHFRPLSPVHASHPAAAGLAFATLLSQPGRESLTHSVRQAGSPSVSQSVRQSPSVRHAD